MVTRYLNVMPFDDALALLAREFSCTPHIMQVPLEEAPGRITAGPIFARYSVPPIHLAAMDGIAVKSRDTIGAREQSPVTITDYVRVNTGNIIPPGYDAVIMIEDVWDADGKYTIRKAAGLWQHIRPAGEDLGESEMVMPSRHTVRPYEVGALATYGITTIDAITVRVGLIPTGSELIAAGTRPALGQVVESNTLMAKAMLEKVGARCTRYPFVEDTPEKIRDAIVRACNENDIVIVSAGSSAGTKDYTADVIAKLGKVLVHGIAMKPGKPAIIGRIDNKPVIGLPGYPLAALTVVRELVLPLVSHYGLESPQPEIVDGQMAVTLPKDISTEEFVLCAIGSVGTRRIITPLSRGAAVQMSAVRANALIRIPAGSEGLEKGEYVTATLLQPRNNVDRALLLTGSHDPVLDYLADLLTGRGVDLHSSHVGSMGGIVALMNDECHAAPMHLLSKDGTYNGPYLIKYMPGQELDLICVAGRQQGIISKDGIGFDELVHHTYVNRQNGAGTRLLFDFELRKRGIDPRDIRGYDRQVTTHLAVALAVKAGEADAGMGVYSAAQALHLRFVPVAQERYEIAIRATHRDDPRVLALIAMIRSPEFRAVLERLGGYDTRDTGLLQTIS
jgi:putative molybdopterin biosynthesis protein